MAEAKYKWDIDGLNTALRRLKNERTNLVQSKTFLMGLRQEVSTNWQGLSGEAYKERLDLDMQNYDKIIAGLDARIDKLNNIVNKHYTDCENQIGSAVRHLASSIKAI